MNKERKITGPLRSKTRRVIRLLEKELGIPKQKRPFPHPLDMLIATILSQNTNDKNSHRAFTNLKSKYPKWDLAAKAATRSLAAAIRSGGMARQKSARIREVLLTTRRMHGGLNPTEMKKLSNDQILSDLVSLHGVGVKTAACVLLFSLGRDVFPVDTHVHRLCTRLGLAPGCTTPDKTFLAMMDRVPQGKGYSFHTNLIRFGRKICRSHRPACELCPLYDECIYDEKEKRPRKSVPSATDHDFMLLDNVAIGKHGGVRH